MILTIRRSVHDLTVLVQNITNNISLSQQCQKMLILFLKKNNNISLNLRLFYNKCDKTYTSLLYWIVISN